MKCEIDHEKDNLQFQFEVNASAQKVFDALTKPELISQWMGPGSVVCKEVTVDPKVGGAYRLHMTSETGDHIAIGKYIEFQPNETLAYTWEWEGGSFKNSEVRFAITEKNGVSSVKVNHTLLPNSEVREHHSQGWEMSFKKLVDFLNR